MSDKKNVCHLIDCMEFMRDLPDDYYDLAIVDPEYGHFITPSKKSFLHTSGMDGIRGTLGINNGTDEEYFKELLRVSTGSIVWGANYFLDYLGSTRGMIIWDKMVYGNTSMNWAEIAWQNVRQQTRVIKLHSSQVREVRIHPNQKSVILYKWLLQNYAKPGQTIFDSHVGSGSIRIACHDMGFDFTGTEIDLDYYNAQEERYKAHASQQTLFTPDEIYAGQLK